MPMRGLAKLFLLTLATVVWAATASAGSIDLTVISDPVPDSGVIFLPSDSISIEVSLDSGGCCVNNYSFHIQWSGYLSVSIVEGSQWLPSFGGTAWWAHLSGNGHR
jgi:hypothetical protein